MRVCVPQHCLSPLSLQPLSKRWRWGEGEALSHLVNAREAKDVHYYDFYGKSSVSFGPLQGPVLAAAMSNNLQFHLQRIVKFPVITLLYVTSAGVSTHHFLAFFPPHCLFLAHKFVLKCLTFLSELDGAGLQWLGTWQYSSSPSAEQKLWTFSSAQSTAGSDPR